MLRTRKGPSGNRSGDSVAKETQACPYIMIDGSFNLEEFEEVLERLGKKELGVIVGVSREGWNSVCSQNGGFIGMVYVVADTIVAIVIMSIHLMAMVNLATVIFVMVIIVTITSTTMLTVIIMITITVNMIKMITITVNMIIMTTMITINITTTTIKQCTRKSRGPKQRRHIITQRLHHLAFSRRRSH